MFRAQSQRKTDNTRPEVAYRASELSTEPLYRANSKSGTRFLIGSAPAVTGKITGNFYKEDTNGARDRGMRGLGKLLFKGQGSMPSGNECSKTIY